MIPPNSSSEPAPDDAGAEPGVALGALVTRLAEEFGASPDTLARVATVFREVREQAPDLFVPAPGTLAPAFTST